MADFSLGVDTTLGGGAPGDATCHDNERFSLGVDTNPGGGAFSDAHYRHHHNGRFSLWVDTNPVDAHYHHDDGTDLSDGVFSDAPCHNHHHHHMPNGGAFSGAASHFYYHMAAPHLSLTMDPSLEYARFSLGVDTNLGGGAFSGAPCHHHHQMAAPHLSPGIDGSGGGGSSGGQQGRDIATARTGEEHLLEALDAAIKKGIKKGPLQGLLGFNGHLSGSLIEDLAVSAETQQQKDIICNAAGLNAFIHAGVAVAPAGPEAMIAVAIAGGFFAVQACHEKVNPPSHEKVKPP